MERGKGKERKKERKRVCVCERERERARGRRWMHASICLCGCQRCVSCSLHETVSSHTFTHIHTSTHSPTHRPISQSHPTCAKALASDHHVYSIERDHGDGVAHCGEEREYGRVGEHSAAVRNNSAACERALVKVCVGVRQKNSNKSER